jgi:hypothetical protein
MHEREESDVGLAPHEGIELELMLAGSKPLAMFLQEGYGAPGGEAYDDLGTMYDEFRPHVERGAIVRREVLEVLPSYGSGSPTLLRRALFARPGEEWRIDAMLAALSALSHPSEEHFREEIERYIGYLLGYTRGEVDAYSAHMRGLIDEDKAASVRMCEVYRQMTLSAQRRLAGFELPSLNDANAVARFAAREFEAVRVCTATSEDVLRTLIEAGCVKTARTASHRLFAWADEAWRLDALELLDRLEREYTQPRPLLRVLEYYLVVSRAVEL